MGKVATSPLPPRASPPLQSGGQNQKWPINGQGGYITLAASGIPIASKRGAKSEVAHKWARWLHQPCRLGDPHRFKAGGKIRSGPYMGKVATSPLPPRGSPPLQSGGQNQKCPKKGGNATSPLHYGGSLAKGTKSKVAELGARTKLWMCSPKQYHEKKFAQMMFVCRKTPLKPPLRPFFKKGGFSKPPTLSDFSEPPPPLGPAL